MAATQNVASFEKRLSVSAAGFGGASRTRISSGSRLPSQAPRQRGAVLRHRAAGWGYAPWRRRGCAGLKRKGEPRQPTATQRHRCGRAVTSTSAANTDSAWTKRSWPKLVPSNTVGIAARTSAAFAAPDMSDASSASHPSSANSAVARLTRTRRKHRPSTACASQAPMSFSPCGATSLMNNRPPIVPPRSNMTAPIPVRGIVNDGFARRASGHRLQSLRPRRSHRLRRPSQR